MKRDLLLDAEDHISPGALDASAAKLIPPSSILFVLRGMILAHSFPVAIAGRELTINQDMRALVLSEPALAPYLLCVLQEARQRVLAQVERSSHGTCRLDSKVVEELLVPIPPMAEQGRIMSRLGELMSRCQELENHQKAKRLVGTRLGIAALNALAEASSAASSDRAWRRVVDHSGVILGSSSAIPVLRSTILQLAMSGALSSHQHGDGTAAEVISGALERRASLVREGRVERTLLPRNDKSELDGTFPSHWERSLLDAVAYVVDPNPSHRNPAYAEVGFPFISTQEFFGEDGLVTDTPRRVAEDVVAEQEERCWFSDRSILFSRKGTIGKTRLLPGNIRLALLDSLVVINPFEPIDPRFLNLALRSPQVQRQIQRMTRGLALAQISVGRVRILQVPVPPAPEQRRIVAVVRPLLAICDALQVKLEERDGIRAGLAHALAANACG